MATEAVELKRIEEPPVEPRRRWAFGPGLVFLVAVVGPQDVITNSTAGATYGYTMLWTLPVIVLARYIMLEATARYVVVTGETLMAGYARGGRWVSWMIAVSIFLKRHFSSLYHILILGSSAHILAPLPTPYSAKIWGFFSGVLASR